MRYEYFSVPTEAHNKAWNFDPKANGLVQQGTTTTLDQYGNACGTVLASDPSLPASIAGNPASLGFTTAATANPKGWNCSGPFRTRSTSK